MRNKIFAISLLISLVTGLDLMADVRIRELSGESFNTISAALYRLTRTDRSQVSPDSNGTVHIDVTGNITETATGRNTYTLRNSSTHKIEISGADGSVVTTSNSTYKINFNSGADATVELKNLRFTGSSFFIAASYESSNTHTATSYFHNCVFAPDVTYDIRAGVSGQGNGQISGYNSDVYRFEYNTWEGQESTNYTINFNASNYNKAIKFIFSNNNVYCFRAFSINANKNYPLDVTMQNNVLYHLQDFSQVEGVASSVALCQINGPVYGNFTLTGNKMLGLFSFGDQVKAPTLFLQHGSGNYKGIVDGSNITITDNLIQCDVNQFAWKAERGGSYETGDVSETVLSKHYYNLDGDSSQHGNYNATIANNEIVHMYYSEDETHDDSDNCHICKSCGQMVIRGRVIGHGGNFQYEGEDGEMHNVNDAVATIPMNLDPDYVDYDHLDLFSYIDYDASRKGFCLNPGESQEFTITIVKEGDFRSLTLYGAPTSPKNITSQASTTDNLVYKYTYTNDFTQAAPYTSCPLIVAGLGSVALIVTCTGLENNENAIFEIRNNSDQLLYTICLNPANPTTAIVGLAPGTYKAVHQSGWDWTYELDKESDQKTINLEDGEATIEFVATKQTTDKKYDESYKNNRINAGS